MIQIPDPFNSNNIFIKPLKNMDLVYPECRYHSDYSPLMLYIPSLWILLKLMRICVGVHFNNETPFWET